MLQRPVNPSVLPHSGANSFAGQSGRCFGAAGDGFWQRLAAAAATAVNSAAAQPSSFQLQQQPSFSTALHLQTSLAADSLRKPVGAPAAAAPQPTSLTRGFATKRRATRASRSAKGKDAAQQPQQDGQPAGRQAAAAAKDSGEPTEEDLAETEAEMEAEM